MISERISNDIPPQIKILNMVIPILMHFCSFFSNWSVARCTMPHIIQQTKCDIINDVKLFPTVYRRIDCRKFFMLSNQTSRYKSKCIRMLFDSLTFLTKIRCLNLHIICSAVTYLIGCCIFYPQMELHERYGKRAL